MAVVLLTLAVLGGAAWVLLAGLAGAPAVSPAEGAFAVRAFAINRFGFDAAHLSWFDGGIGALQVAAYETVSGALGRAGSTVVAAREAMVVATVLAGICLAMAARRLQLSVPATVAALLLYGFVPVALLLHRTVDPANLAAMWACAGLAVASGGSRRPGAAVVAGGYLVLAVVSAPVVLAALVPLAACLFVSGDLGRLPVAGRLAVGGLGLLGYGALVRFAAAGTLPGITGNTTLPPVTGQDKALIAVAVAGALIALLVRWLRPLAAGLLGLGIAAMIIDDARLPLAILALPLAALLVPALADAGVNRWRVWWTERSRQAGQRPGRALVAVPVAVVGIVAVTLVATWVPAVAATRKPTGIDRSLDRATAWVMTSLPTRPRLAVDDALWAKLIGAGYPGEQLVAVGGLGLSSAGVPRGWSDCVFVIGRDASLLSADPADPARQAREHSAIVAGWGVGTDRINARRILLDPAAALTQAVRDARSRVEAGTALVDNPRLTLAPEAKVLLRRGDVDARIIAVLAAISGLRTLEISTFPPVDGEDDRLPRRQVTVTMIDRQPVAAGATAADQLDQWLAAQQSPYRPASTAVMSVLDRTALVIRYDAVRQPGLLPP